MTQGSTKPVDTIRVWVIDDSAPNRQVTRAVLERAGMEVQGSDETASGLLAHLDAGLPPPDVVIADLVNPYEPAGSLGHLSTLLAGRGPRVFHVSHDRSQDRELIDGGACGVMGKPIEPRALAAAVRAVAAGCIVLEEPKRLPARDPSRAPAAPAAAKPVDGRGERAGTPLSATEGAGLAGRLADELHATDGLVWALSKLLSQAAHDMNAGLSAIDGWASVAAESLSGTEPTGFLESLTELGKSVARNRADAHRLWQFVRPAGGRVGSRPVHDLNTAAFVSPRYYHGSCPVEIDLGSAVPLVVPVETGRVAAAAGAAIRALASAVGVMLVRVETRAVPATRTGPGYRRFGRLRVAGSIDPDRNADNRRLAASLGEVAVREFWRDDPVVVTTATESGGAAVDLWFPLVEP